MRRKLFEPVKEVSLSSIDKVTTPIYGSINGFETDWCQENRIFRLTILPYSRTSRKHYTHLLTIVPNLHVLVNRTFRSLRTCRSPQITSLHSSWINLLPFSGGIDVRRTTFGLTVLPHSFRQGYVVSRHVGRLQTLVNWFYCEVTASTNDRFLGRLIFEE